MAPGFPSRPFLLPQLSTNQVSSPILIVVVLNNLALIKPGMEKGSEFRFLSVLWVILNDALAVLRHVCPMGKPADRLAWSHPNPAASMLDEHPVGEEETVDISSCPEPVLYFLPEPSHFLHPLQSFSAAHFRTCPLLGHSSPANEQKSVSNHLPFLSVILRSGWLNSSCI